MVNKTIHVGDYVRESHVISEIFKIQPVPITILDAGSGNGDYAIHLGRKLRVSSIIGVEINPEHVRYANYKLHQANISNVSFIEGDITKNLDRDRFDLIYSVDVMEHIQDDMSVFKNFYNALKPNGILVLHVPKKTQRFFLNFLGIFTRQSDHVRDGYDEDEIGKIIKGIGFEIRIVKNTFGMCASFIWEIMQLLKYLGPIGNATWKLLFPLLKPVVDREFKKPQKYGNGLLLVARKGIQVA